MLNADGHLSELRELITLFHESLRVLGDFTECELADVPAPFDRLLVHEHHMTVTVESFHDSLVDVEVLKFKTKEDCYHREILLRRQSDNSVVQYGIVDLDSTKLPAAARQRIESREIPLGRVLIEDDVMRHVELIAAWKIDLSDYLAGLLEIDSQTSTYGRSARIHVQGEPVIKLLEIVTPE